MCLHPLLNLRYKIHAPVVTWDTRSLCSLLVSLLLVWLPHTSRGCVRHLGGNLSYLMMCNIAPTMAAGAVAAWRQLIVLLIAVLLFLDAAAARQCLWPGQAPDDAGCLSWRVMVEANNARGWRTVPAQCVGYVKGYMTRGQYLRDLAGVMQQASEYADQVAAGAGADADGLDAWVFDIDDTCLSNLPYYETKQFGAYDPSAFKAWASREACPGIPPVLGLFTALLDRGFKVFLLSGRDEESLGPCTAGNLEAQGFSGYERLIMRTPEYRGQSSSVFKSAMRKQLVDEGFRIRGNVGDQWSDLQGDCVGDRVFKIPNPMYFVP